MGMQALSKAQLVTLKTLFETLTTRYEAFEEAVDDFNATQAEAWNEVLAAEEAYNEAVTTANEWLGEVKEAIEEYVNERSEKWQESDRGQAYAAWLEAFSVELEESDLSEPAELTLDVDNAAGMLEDLPE